MKLSVPMLVLAAGLSAAANTFAQTNVTGTVTGGKVTSTTTSNTVLSDGNHEVRIESDGVTARITLDGKQVAQLTIADDWTTHKVADASGNIIATVWRAPGASALSASFGDINNQPLHGYAGQGGQWTGKIQALMQDEKVREGIAQARGHLESALARAGREIPRVMIGITMEDTPDNLVQSLGYATDKTSYIGSVIDGGPAAKAGLQEGDVIIAFDNGTSADAAAIRDALKDNNPGDQIPFSYIRDGAVKTGTMTLEAYDPVKFGATFMGNGTPSGNGIRQFFLSDEEMSNLQKQIAELSEKLEAISSELATAIGARAEELGKASARLGTQIAELASELARRSASAFSSQFWNDTTGQNQMTVRVQPNGSGGAQKIYLMPTPAAPPAPPAAPGAATSPAPAAAPGDPAALQSMDDRIRRIEQLLEQLAAQQAEQNARGNH